MRLWSLHPRYLDPKGLTALWREALLAQAVLLDRTKGYRNHPQLERFRRAHSPVSAVGAYLSAVHAEADSRGFSFNYNKIVVPGDRVRMQTTRGQLAYEFRRLLGKLKLRDPGRYRKLKGARRIMAHPLFSVRPGSLEQWERVPRPVVVVSRCLGFAACRYDGTMVESLAVRSLRSSVRFIPVCPEMGIGLGVPRHTVRIVETRGRRRLVQAATGKDLTARMRRFAKKCLSSSGRIDGFILKSRSPSCGLRDAKVYSSANPLRAAVKGKSCGYFAEAAMDSFPDAPIIDERRLAGKRNLSRFLAKVRDSAALGQSASERNMP